MGLEPITYGSLGSSTQMNANNNYLDGRITTVASSISSLSSQISSVNTTLSNNKANKDLSNVSDSTLASKMTTDVLTPTVLTNAGCITSSNISSASSSTKSTVIGWGMPDYYAGISITQNTTYTCTSNGWVLVYRYTDYESQSDFYLNGTQFKWAYRGGNYDDANFAIIPVSPGNTVRLTLGTIIFFPMKGA